MARDPGRSQVVRSDRRGAVLAHTLMDIDPRYPAVSKARRQELLEFKGRLEEQSPKGAAPDPFEAERS